MSMALRLCRPKADDQCLDEEDAGRDTQIFTCVTTILSKTLSETLVEMVTSLLVCMHSNASVSLNFTPINKRNVIYYTSVPLGKCGSTHKFLDFLVFVSFNMDKMNTVISAQ
jgi:hypothetical protein